MSPRLAVVPELESELDDLFGRPLSEFTPARNELAKRLRKAGQEDAAERVQALKKPSVPVWAANQLARRHPDEVQALIDAGARLRKAQEAAFRSDEGREAVRDATRDEREAARALGRLAHELLAEEGRPATRDVSDRIASLLRAAAIDPDTADHLAAGRLAEEVETSGFGAVAGIAPPPRTTRRKAPSTKEDQARRREEEQRRKRLEAEVKKLRRAAEQADAKVEKAEAAAEQARAQAEEARQALAAAETELDD
jgi:hypothetical protein